MIIRKNIAISIEEKDIVKGKLIIPKGVTHIGDGFSFSYTSLKKIVIPNTVKYIGNYFS